MALTKSAVTLLAAAAVVAGSTKATPGRDSGAIDCRAFYGGLLTYAITNGASAPTVALSLTFQVSTDGQNWRDLWTVGGDTASGSAPTGAITLPRGTMYLRAIAYGNVTNPVTVAAELQAIASL